MATVTRRSRAATIPLHFHRLLLLSWKLASCSRDGRVRRGDEWAKVSFVARHGNASPDHLVVQPQAAADVSGWEGELSCEPDVEGKALGPDDLGRLWRRRPYFCGHHFWASSASCAGNYVADKQPRGSLMCALIVGYL
jgi:hypothetical protein